MERLLQAMEPVLQAPEDEEIAELYSLIRQNPNLFQAFDKEQFTDTPLHLAAAHGRTQLALEIQRLMPSFGQKLNPNGFSPVHMALQRGHAVTVSAMIKLNPELVRVQGREGITPLHHAAETDDVDMLAEFLLSCPDSIDDLKVRMESAAHVAVKYRKMEAFRVLLGWLKRIRRTEVLRWRDYEGNNVLHLAASTNQPEAMELLGRGEVRRWVKEKNSKGLTALDIVMELPTEVNGRALDILHGKRSKRESSVREHKVATFADYLSSEIKFIETITSFGTFLEKMVNDGTRNAILVVAVLIATAAYQAVLSPPGGFSDQSQVILNIASVPYNSSTATNITCNIGVDAPKNQCADDERKCEFVYNNSLALVLSLGMILILRPTVPFGVFLDTALLYLMLSYEIGMKFQSATASSKSSRVIVVSYFIFLLIMAVKTFVRHGLGINVWTSRLLMGSNNFFNIHEVEALVYDIEYQRNYPGGKS